MSSGSWGSFAEDPYIGTSPMHMDAYAKQYLGWLDLKTLNAGDRATFKLGPAEHDTSHDYQAAAINLLSDVLGLSLSAFALTGVGFLAAGTLLVFVRETLQTQPPPRPVRAV